MLYPMQHLEASCRNYLVIACHEICGCKIPPWLPFSSLFPRTCSAHAVQHRVDVCCENQLPYNALEDERNSSPDACIYISYGHMTSSRNLDAVTTFPMVSSDKLPIAPHEPLALATCTLSLCGNHICVTFAHAPSLPPRVA
jgi:hypothetical protein